MWAAYSDDVEFLVVYIREAHAIDSFLPKGGGGDPIVEDPKTIEERSELAQVCLSTLALDPIPAVVDTLDDAASRAYEAWPDRLYLIGKDGKVAYRGGPGPDGFDVGELEGAIVSELAGDEVGRGRSPTPQPGSSAVDIRTDEARRADDAHSILSQWWRIEGTHFSMLSTCNLATARFASQWADWVHPHLVKVFGVAPPNTDKPVVLVARNLLQYNAFAFTRPGPDRVPPEARGFSAFHHAFPCDSWLDLDEGGTRSRPSGSAAGYWDDRTPRGNLWGPYSVRHAAAQAFAEALDPSPQTVAAYLDGQPFDAAAHWGEKQLPLWLRYGAAMYAERFFVDENASDPTSIRQWSFAEVRDVVGLRPDPARGDVQHLVRSAVEHALACDLDMRRVEESRRAILVAGALVSFALDGGDPRVEAAHAAFRDAMVSGVGVRGAADALGEALRTAAPAFWRFITG